MQNPKVSFFVEQDAEPENAANAEIDPDQRRAITWSRRKSKVFQQKKKRKKLPRLGKGGPNRWSENTGIAKKGEGGF